ncbi:966_t:CDS:2 [Acaulospora morrowiae]|uniref:966_t:CDS:1 n=1 Tax=Acaulospora morrowiae TaxID=94023 RepID=A0A9N8VDP1_9GLOM|nr:966_t:CDS:2 [Acaulospora morrowiae]
MHAGVFLNDAILLEKAGLIAMQLNITDEIFKKSNGWLSRFKVRHGIHQIKLHGEADSAPLDALPEMRATLQELLSTYAPKDIFNADETGLFWRILPNKTLSIAPLTIATISNCWKKTQIITTDTSMSINIDKQEDQLQQLDLALNTLKPLINYEIIESQDYIDIPTENTAIHHMLSLEEIINTVSQPENSITENSDDELTPPYLLKIDLQFFVNLPMNLMKLSYYRELTLFFSETVDVVPKRMPEYYYYRTMWWEKGDFNPKANWEEATEDSVTSDPYWPCEKLQDRGLNVVHFWHDESFENDDNSSNDLSDKDDNSSSNALSDENIPVENLISVHEGKLIIMLDLYRKGVVKTSPFNRRSFEWSIRSDTPSTTMTTSLYVLSSPGSIISDEFIKAEKHRHYMDYLIGPGVSEWHLNEDSTRVNGSIT